MDRPLPGMSITPEMLRPGPEESEPQRDRRNAERIGAGARIAPVALSRVAEGSAAKLFYWSSVQCQTVDQTHGLGVKCGPGNHGARVEQRLKTGAVCTGAEKIRKSD